MEKLMLSYGVDDGTVDRFYFYRHPRTCSACTSRKRTSMFNRRQHRSNGFDDDGATARGGRGAREGGCEMKCVATLAFRNRVGPGSELERVRGDGEVKSSTGY